ncbi:MAG: transcription initiation factor IIB family protein [Candidatus Methanomethyliaceae archaeon]
MPLSFIAQIPERPTFREEGRRPPKNTPLLHDLGIGSTIWYGERDGNGKRLSASAAARAAKLRRTSKISRIRGFKERSLATGLGTVERICSCLALPDYAREEAATAFRRLREGGRIHYESNLNIAAAAVYIACRRFRMPRSLGEIARAACWGAGEAELKKVRRGVIRVMRACPQTVPALSYEAHVARACSNLNLSGAAMKEALALLGMMRERGATAGKTPQTIAGACAYLAAARVGSPVTQEDAARAAGITTVSIRNLIKALRNKEKLAK